MIKKHIAIIISMLIILLSLKLYVIFYSLSIRINLLKSARAKGTHPKLILQRNVLFWSFLGIQAERLKWKQLSFLGHTVEPTRRQIKSQLKIAYIPFCQPLNAITSQAQAMSEYKQSSVLNCIMESTCQKDLHTALAHDCLLYGSFKSCLKECV